MEIEPTLKQEICKGQLEDEKLLEIKKQLTEGQNAPGCREDERGTLWYKDRICVPDNKTLRQLILSEAHDTTYTIHPGSTKMYHDLKDRF